MKIGKRTLLEIEPYADELEYDDFMLMLGEIVAKRFKTGYVKCSAENMGWRNLSGHKVFEFDYNGDFRSIARDFLNGFTPDCDWCATVKSLNDGKGLYFRLSTHDSPMGESYYLTPISERTYERLS